MDAEIDPQHARKSSVLVELLSVARRSTPRDILVVGCGSGLEAGILARHFEARTVGIDLDTDGFDPRAAAPATLVGMDARNSAFWRCLISRCRWLEWRAWLRRART